MFEWWKRFRKSGDKSGPKPAPNPAPKPAPESVADSFWDSEPESEPKPTPKPPPQFVSEFRWNSEPKPEPKSKSKPESKSTRKPVSKPPPKPESKLTPKSTPTPPSKPKSNPKTKSASKPSTGTGGLAALPKGRLTGRTDSATARRFTIGLDFGTSSTKCMLREERDDAPFRVVAYPDPVDEYGPLLYPSTVTIDGDDLLFGHAAELAANRSTIRSFKMCIPCTYASARRCARCLKDRPGFLQLKHEQLPAEELSALYLAVVLRHAQRALSGIVGSKPTRVFINSAAPLAQLNTSSELRESFERVLFQARLLIKQARDRWPLAEALAALDSVRNQAVPAAKKRTTFIVPETQAAITAFILLPDTERGNYATIDVGAGTTDVAFFWLQNDQGRDAAIDDTPKVWYYATGTDFRGLDDIDRSLKSRLRSPAGASIRSAREALSPNQLESMRSRFGPVCEKISLFYRSILDQSRNVYRKPTAWNRDGRIRYRVLLVGGGARFGPLAALLEEPPAHWGEWNREPITLWVPQDTQVVCGGKKLGTLRDTAGDTQRSNLLLLAYGLAHRRIDIPPYDKHEIFEPEIVVNDNWDHARWFGEDG